MKKGKAPKLQNENKNTRKALLKYVPPSKEAPEDVTPKSLSSETYAELEQNDKDGIVVGDIDSLFSTCSICNDPKVQKERAIASTSSVERAQAVRTLVDEFKQSMNHTLKHLSSKIEDQLKPIVALTSEIAVTRAGLTNELNEFEEHLKHIFGIVDTIDSKEMGEAIFINTEEGEPLTLLLEEPRPGENTEFDVMVGTINEVLKNNDPENDFNSEYPKSGASVTRQ